MSRGVWAQRYDVANDGTVFISRRSLSKVIYTQRSQSCLVFQCAIGV